MGFLENDKEDENVDTTTECDLCGRECEESDLSECSNCSNIVCGDCISECPGCKNNACDGCMSTDERCSECGEADDPEEKSDVKKFYENDLKKYLDMWSIKCREVEDSEPFGECTRSIPYTIGFLTANIATSGSKVMLYYDEGSDSIWMQFMDQRGNIYAHQIDSDTDLDALKEDLDKEL